eukprot:10610183-Lingulodinium_polyedra.AAC.1
MEQHIMLTLWTRKPTSAGARSLTTRPFHGHQQEVRDAQHVRSLPARTVLITRETGRNAHGTTSIQYTGNVTRA